MTKITKGDIHFIIKNWNEMSKEEIAKKLDIAATSLQNILVLIRKSGYDLPRRNRPGLKDVVAEAIAEL